MQLIVFQVHLLVIWFTHGALNGWNLHFIFIYLDQKMLFILFFHICFIGNRKTNFFILLKFYAIVSFRYFVNRVKHRSTLTWLVFCINWWIVRLLSNLHNICNWIIIHYYILISLIRDVNVLNTPQSKLLNHTWKLFIVWLVDYSIGSNPSCMIIGFLILKFWFQ